MSVLSCLEQFLIKQQNIVLKLLKTLTSHESDLRILRVISLPGWENAHVNRGVEVLPVEIGALTGELGGFVPDEGVHA